MPGQGVRVMAHLTKLDHTNPTRQHGLRLGHSQHRRAPSVLVKGSRGTSVSSSVRGLWPFGYIEYLEELADGFDHLPARP